MQRRKWREGGKSTCCGGHSSSAKGPGQLGVGRRRRWSLGPVDAENGRIERIGELNGRNEEKQQTGVKAGLLLHRTGENPSRKRIRRVGRRTWCWIRRCRRRRRWRPASCDGTRRWGCPRRPSRRGRTPRPTRQNPRHPRVRRRVPPRGEEGGCDAVRRRWRGRSRHRVGEREGRRGGETEGLRGEGERGRERGSRDGEREREREEGSRYFGRFT